MVEQAFVLSRFIKDTQWPCLVHEQGKAHEELVGAVTYKGIKVYIYVDWLQGHAAASG